MTVALPLTSLAATEQVPKIVAVAGGPGSEALVQVQEAFESLTLTVGRCRASARDRDGKGCARLPRRW